VIEGDGERKGGLGGDDVPWRRPVRDVFRALRGTNLAFSGVNPAKSGGASPSTPSKTAGALSRLTRLPVVALARRRSRR